MKNYKTSQLKIYNNNGHKYIYVYYKEDNHTLRINTKFEYVNNKMTKENLYNSKMNDYNKFNGHIQEIQWVVDSYINLVSGHRPVNQKECMRFVKENKYHASKVPVETINKMTSLSEYYDQFFEDKKMSPLLKNISLKNYTSFKNFLQDFQKYTKQKYYLVNLDKRLINNMIAFSQVDLRDLVGYRSKGHLQQNTLLKRLDVFKEFLSWLEENNIASYNISNLFPKIKKTSKEIVYITSDELLQLINTKDKIKGDYNQLAFNSFIFNCECGLRYEDISNLSKSDFTKIPEGYLLTKELHKQNERFETEVKIPIVDPLLIGIIEIYDFHFELKSNQVYNRTLHTIFKQQELFTDPITVKRKYPKGVVEEDNILKNDVITCHSCRRSMITNAFYSGHNTAQVMQMSGHKSLQTVQKYANFVNDELLSKNIEMKVNAMKMKYDDSTDSKSESNSE